MAEMDTERLLTMLKQGLEIITDYMDEDERVSKEHELLWYIEASMEYIEREGIKLTTSYGDYQLVTMYGMWLYDKRKTTGSKYTSYYIQNMPRMLRYNLNNRLMQEKVNDS